MKLVKITWIDSRGGRGAWSWTEDAEHLACECISVGYVLHDDDKAIHIAGSISDDGEQFNGDIIIPKSAIITLKKLK